MRIHATDPGADQLLVRWQGVPLTTCVAVDTDEGWADLIAMDDRGYGVCPGEITIERIYGEFTVEPLGAP